MKTYGYNTIEYIDNKVIPSYIPNRYLTATNNPTVSMEFKLAHPIRKSIATLLDSSSSEQEQPFFCALHLFHLFDITEHKCT